MRVTENDLKYDVIMRESDGKVSLCIKEIGLISTGSTLEDAYKGLMRQKEAFVKEVNEAGFLDLLPRPTAAADKWFSSSGQQSTGQDNGLRGLRSLAIKTALVTVVVGLVLAPIGLRTKMYIDSIRDRYLASLSQTASIITQLQPKPATQIIRETATELRAMKAADHVKLLEDMQSISDSFRPYLHELRYMTGSEKRHFDTDILVKEEMRLEKIKEEAQLEKIKLAEEAAKEETKKEAEGGSSAKMRSLSE